MRDAHEVFLGDRDPLFSLGQARRHLIRALGAAELYGHGIQPQAASPHPIPIPAALWGVLKPLWADNALANRDGRIEFADVAVTDRPPVSITSRPGASRDYSGADAPLVAEMRQLLAIGAATTPTEAARLVADRAAGGGTEYAKVRRLAGRLK